MIITSLHAQMRDGKFGNEWINYNQSYYKIMLAEDGIYRVDQSSLVAAGVPVDQIATGNFQLFRLGEEVPMFVSSNTTLGNGDYIEFYGQKNRSTLDRNLFENPDEEMLNPEFSLFTDTMSYFLTWKNTGGNLRVTEQANNIGNAPAKEEFFMYEDLQVYTTKPNGNNGHIKKKITSQGVAYSDYVEAEGFSYGFRLTTNLTIKPKHVYENEPFSKLRTRFTVNNPNNPPGHQQIISIEGQEVFNESMSDFEVKEISIDYPTTSLDNNVAVKFEGVNGNNDRQAVSVLSLTYPRLFNFDDENYFEFTIRESNTPIYLEIENFNHGGSSPVLYDMTNNLRLEGIVEAGLVKFLLPSSPNERQLKLASTQAINNPSLTARNFTDLTTTPAAYLIISNPRLYDDGQGVNQVQAYADYRGSATGGGYSTRIVNINDLYDQFSYGIHRHPFSVKNFVQKIKSEWGEELKYLLIIGKGREYHQVRSTDEMTNAYSSFFVPTYGFPGSDNLLTSEAGAVYPAVAMGRLAAINGADVGIYLKKVKDLEFNQQNAPQTIEGRAWMKEVLHLGGGGNDGERTLIQNYLTNLEETIEGNEFGANVTSVYKSNNDPVQQSKSEVIFNRINAGISMLTFFGHSGVGTFDFDIDDPGNYENFGKYPLMFSLGCYSGNIHSSTRGISERFVYYEDKAAIGFIASTALATPTPLYRLTSVFYDLAGNSHYGKGMGDIFQHTLSISNNSSSSSKLLIEQFTLQGDPAVRLSTQEGPDYIINRASIETDPTEVNIQDPSYQLKFNINNLGKNKDDSMFVKIVQRFPNGTSITPYLKKVPAPKNKETYKVVMPTFGKESVGLNRLEITIDVENDIAEYPVITGEQNNELIDVNGVKGIDLFINSNGVDLVYPRPYAIVNRPDFHLMASTLNPLLEVKNYIFEIDTIKSFNSGFKQRYEVAQSGGVLKWQPEIEWEDEQVYYWRVASVENNSSNLLWENSSFVYILNSNEGWNQSHYQQVMDNEYENIQFDSANHQMTFVDDIRDVRIKNKIWEPGNSPVYYNNSEAWGSPFRWTINEGLQIVVRANNTLKYWVNPPEGAYNSINGSSTIVPFPYKTNTIEERTDLINFLRDTIPSGYFVIIYSVQRSDNADFTPELWAGDEAVNGSSIFSVLEDQGAELVRGLENTGAVPYVFMYQKDVGKLSEGLAEDIYGIVDITQGLVGFWHEGSGQSNLIGPASTWNKVEWNYNAMSNPETDTTSISIFGVNPSTGTDTLLYETVMVEELDIQSISAEKYPFLRLSYDTEDLDNRTPSNLTKWRVLFDPLPEVVPNPILGYEMYNDTLSQGEQFQLTFGIENVSATPMDSLLIKYTITDANNDASVIEKRITPIDSWGTTMTDFELSTRELSGMQNIRVEINANQDQAEFNYNNNILSNDFLIETDKVNPFIDVTFDGIHIMNGDIISPKPIIAVSLQDENPYLELSDTSNIRLLIIDPNGNTQSVSYTDPTVDFSPGLSPKEKAVLRYQPTFTTDGIYNLIVQAKDASGNNSGNLDYKTAFEIVNKRAISNVLNYPNPFSSSTRFVYTLTGDVPPEQFAIQIFTVSGKIIREITQDEIGSLKIGTHQTDYAWDGTDEYGDRLANGVYLYRMIAKDDSGQDYEKIDTKTDQYFRKGFGKMVILR